MSRRKHFELIQYPEFQIHGGMIDVNKPKTIYLQIRTHLFADNNQGPQELKHLFWGIKQSINRALDNSICDKRFISELDFSESFKDKPYSYVIMDFTFYLLDQYDDTTYEYFLNQVVKTLHRENIISTPFKMYKDKKQSKLENQNISSLRSFD
jgi:spore germination protein YaaH